MAEKLNERQKQEIREIREQITVLLKLADQLPATREAALAELQQLETHIRVMQGVEEEPSNREAEPCIGT
jgi:hypothetical protein